MIEQTNAVSAQSLIKVPDHLYEGYIFDMDGTIVASVPAVYEAIKRAFKKLGWPVNFFNQSDMSHPSLFENAR